MALKRDSQQKRGDRATVWMTVHQPPYFGAADPRYGFIAPRLLAS
ncbi:MAG: hypothetical protein ACFB0C_05845 [Leptolyngbyaceae cyanobacterium]